MMFTVRLPALLAAVCVAVPAIALAQGSGGVTSSKPHARATTRAVSRLAVRDSTGVKVNEFMSYHASTKTVKISLAASLGSGNGGMNFNGGFKGDQTITVPVGWTVRMPFVNKDAIPHSAIILPDKFPLPMTPGNPAIARAYTTDVTGGIPTDGTDTLDFKTTKPGNYLIVCGVPGHGPSGMYIKFVVSERARVPSYTR